MTKSTGLSMREENELTPMNSFQESRDTYDREPDAHSGGVKIFSYRGGGPLALLFAIPLFLVCFVLIAIAAVAAGVIWTLGGKRISKILINRAMKSQPFFEAPDFNGDIIDVEGEVIDVNIDS